MADYFLKVGKPGSATTLSAPGYTTGATTITVGSTANWPTDTKVAFAIDRAEIVAGEEVQIAGTYTEWTGQVTGATTIGSMVLSSDSPNSDQNYAAGSLTRVYIPVSATRENNLIDGILEHANQDGTLITQAVRDALSLGVGSGTGWEVGSLPDVSTVTDNGNRSYDITFASAIDSILSEGMRVRTTRNSAAGITCFSLDGSNDYLNKTSPAGMTFTDDFTVSAWVYMTSYPAADTAIASRFNNTNGWLFGVKTSGQITLQGYNGGAGNASYINSYQSVPLNKWVHIAAQLDMNTFTATTTTSYIMINGKDVPASVARGGTNPTALVQAGNLEIGSYNGGNGPFPGYIKDVAIYNSKVTQATISASRNQPLTGSEANLISAYSGANTTDLNTTNANNLTAQNGAVTGFASAPWGNRGLSTTLDYGLVMSVSGSTAVVQVPEGCTIPTTGGVSAVAYSVMASPFGFVSDKGRWIVGTYINAQSNVALTSNATWYNLNHSITVPIGKWLLGFQLGVNFSHSGATYLGGPVTLSTGNNTESDKRFTYYGTAGSNVSTTSTTGQGNKVNDVSLAAQTTYYLNAKPTNNNTTATVDVTGTSILFATPAGL